MTLGDIYNSVKKFGNLAFGPDISAEYVIYHFWYTLSGFLFHPKENFEISHFEPLQLFIYLFFFTSLCIKFKREWNDFNAWSANNKIFFWLYLRRLQLLQANFMRS